MKTIKIEHLTIVVPDNFSVSTFIEKLEELMTTYGGKDWQYKFDVEDYLDK